MDTGNFTTQSDRTANWLELMVAPSWKKAAWDVHLHAVDGSAGHCFVISAGDRWLRANNGALTVFFGLDSAMRFLELLGVDDFERVALSDHQLLRDAESAYLVSVENGELRFRAASAGCIAACPLRTDDSCGPRPDVIHVRRSVSGGSPKRSQ